MAVATAMPADSGSFERRPTLVISAADSAPQPRHRAIAVEVPLSIEYGGIAYAVMMVTPIDLQDFVIGFSLSEELIHSPADIKALEISKLARGWVARVTLDPSLMSRISERARMRVSEGSCGLCGLENLEQVMRPLPAISGKPTVGADAIFSALDALSSHQALSLQTGAAHAAAFCNEAGHIIAVREDIGRHNALDKLIGALVRSDINAERGFILLTARCSYELVEKTILARCPLLVTISAPSTLAIDRAKAHGLTLISLARADSMLAAHDPHGLFSVNQPMTSSTGT